MTQKLTTRIGAGINHITPTMNIIEVDTSLGEVQIIMPTTQYLQQSLGGIPVNFSIQDISGKASVNNIIIKPATNSSETINKNTEVILNTNNVSAIINPIYGIGYTCISNSFDNNQVIYIQSKSDFPPPVNNVITLLVGKTYIITNEIDLLGDRLVTGGICNLLGESSETSYLTSTGLEEGIPLLTSEYTIVIESLTFKDVDTCFYINGNNRTVALDWENVNFSNIPNMGIINTCDNFIFETGAILSSQGLVFTGTVATIGIINSLLSGTGSDGTIITIDENTTITRRFRIIYSSFVVTSDTKGINVHEEANIPTESYILDTVNFSGGGTYIQGLTEASNKSLFSNCTGINNTSANGQLYMINNSTPTIITDTTNFVKVAGTTTPSSDNSKYTHANNRLTNDAIIERKYLIQATITFVSGNNNVCEFGFYDSRLEGVRVPSRTKSTANSSGRAENISLTCVVNQKKGDYIEVWCRNNSIVNNITVEALNFVITEIN